MSDLAETSPLRQRLRDDLKAAMRRRDRATLAVLRTTLAAVDNAEAVAVEAPAAGSSLAIEHIPLGVGAAEAERRVLTDEDVVGIVQGELDERLRAAEGYDGAGRPDHAEKLRAEAGILAAALAV